MLSSLTYLVYAAVITSVLSNQNKTLDGPPDWAVKIATLREKLGCSQAELGERLGFSAMSISRWERGTQEPSTACYVQLGNLTGSPDCWLFWQRAGLDITSLVGNMPDLRRPITEPVLVVAHGTTHRPDEVEKALVALPVLSFDPRTQPLLPALSLDDTAVVSMMAAPKEWCPNPKHTICLHLRGDSMSPMMRDGDVVAIDQFENTLSDLVDKIIVMSHPERGLVIATLRRFGGVYVLEPGNQGRGSFPLGKDRRWHVLGKVLWWLSKAP